MVALEFPFRLMPIAARRSRKHELGRRTIDLAVTATSRCEHRSQPRHSRNHTPAKDQIKKVRLICISLVVVENAILHKWCLCENVLSYHLYVHSKISLIREPCQSINGTVGQIVAKLVFLAHCNRGSLLYCFDSGPEKLPQA